MLPTIDHAYIYTSHNYNHSYQIQVHIHFLLCTLYNTAIIVPSLVHVSCQVAGNPITIVKVFTVW